MWALTARRPGPLRHGDLVARPPPPLRISRACNNCAAMDEVGLDLPKAGATGEGLLSPANGVLGTL